MTRICTRCARSIEIEPAIEGIQGLLCFPCRYYLDQVGGEAFHIALQQFHKDRDAWNVAYSTRYKIYSLLCIISGVAFFLSVCCIISIIFLEQFATSLGPFSLIGCGVTVLFMLLAKLYSCPDSPDQPFADTKAKFSHPVVLFAPNVTADGDAALVAFKNGYPSDWDQRRFECLQRDNNTCRLCNSRQRLHIHHIKPISFGGTHSLQNLITLCHNCHMKQEYYQHRELVSFNIKAKNKYWVDSYMRSDGVAVQGHSRRIGRRGKFWKGIRRYNYD